MLNAARNQIQRAVAAGHPEDRIEAALTRMRDAGLSLGRLPQLLTEAQTARRSNGHKLSTTDQRVNAGRALAQRYREAGQ
jgi:hypothetical protein